jgi:hypothetical protein
MSGCYRKAGSEGPWNHEEAIVFEWRNRRWRTSSQVTGGPPSLTVDGGSIPEWELDDVGIQIGFWRRLDRNLDRLPLVDADRSRIVASLEAVIPRPDEAKLAKAERAKDYAASLARGEAIVAELGLNWDEDPAGTG